MGLSGTFPIQHPVKIFNVSKIGTGLDVRNNGFGFQLGQLLIVVFWGVINFPGWIDWLYWRLRKSCQVGGRKSEILWCPRSPCRLGLCETFWILALDFLKDTNVCSIQIVSNAANGLMKHQSNVGSLRNKRHNEMNASGG